MKKSTLAFTIVFLLLGAYLLYDAGFTTPMLAEWFGGSKGVLRKVSLSFLEDLQFKDFDKAATYHHPDDQKKVNIPKLIERLFQVKPELLDIMEYEILNVDIDSSGNRARVKLKTKVHLLNTDKIRQPEVMLYFHKKNDKWYMELESSLH